MEEERSVENDWLYGEKASDRTLSFLKEQRKQGRKDKKQAHELNRQNEQDKFTRDLIREVSGLVVAAALLLFSVDLSKNDYKDEAAMVAGVAGGIGGGFSVLTGNTLHKKGDE